VFQDSSASSKSPGRSGKNAFYLKTLLNRWAVMIFHVTPCAYGGTEFHPSVNDI
jgi:hypothetical protein